MRAEIVAQIIVTINYWTGRVYE